MPKGEMHSAEDIRQVPSRQIARA